MLPGHQLRSESCMVVDDHISDKVAEVCVQQGLHSNFKLALVRQTMVDLAQRPAATERTQQNSLNSLEFGEAGSGYHFASCCCLCPLTAALPSAHHQTCYQLPELRSGSLRAACVCTGSSSSAQLQSSLPAGTQVPGLSPCLKER